MTDSYAYIPEVLGVCDLCNRDVTEEDESHCDDQGYMHQACIDHATGGTSRDR